MKQKIIFDTSDAQSILDSDNIGAYLRASDGTLLTHTDVGGKKALDVYIAEGINVEVDLDAADDSVASWTNDGAGNPIGSTGGALHISDAGGSLTVDATDLDIRDLTQADEVTVFQGTDPWIVGDGGGSLTVDATDLDIRDLNAASDSVESWTNDGAGNPISSTGGALHVFVDNEIETNDVALADTAIASAALTLAVANTSQAAVASPLAARKYLWIHNNFNKTIFIGASGITQANGFPLEPSVTLPMRAGPGVAIHFVGRTGDTPNIRTLELS